MKLAFPFLTLGSAFGALMVFAAPGVANTMPQADPAGQSAEVQLRDLAQLLQFAEAEGEDDDEGAGDDDEDNAPCLKAGGDDDDEGEGEGGCVVIPKMNNGAPVAPPDNGLFESGSTPQVKVN